MDIWVESGSDMEYSGKRAMLILVCFFCWYDMIMILDEKSLGYSNRESNY